MKTYCFDINSLKGRMINSLYHLIERRGFNASKESRTNAYDAFGNMIDTLGHSETVGRFTYRYCDEISDYYGLRIGGICLLVRYE